MSKPFQPILLAAILAAGMAAAILPGSAPAQAAEGRHKAMITGLAVGAVGGVVLDRLLQGGLGGSGGASAPGIDEPQPVYDAPRPVYSAPRPVYSAPRPVYDAPRVVHVRQPTPQPDPYFNRMSSLKASCDDGDTTACIRFGMIIGQHKEREAEWRRQHPDMFAWERE